MENKEGRSAPPTDFCILEDSPPPPCPILTPSIASYSTAAPPFKFKKSNDMTPSRQRGLTYERKVLASLGDMYKNFPGYTFQPHPWFCYRLPGIREVKWLQPDFLLFQHSAQAPSKAPPKAPVEPEGAGGGGGLKSIVIGEIKLSHTIAAYYALRGNYEPVVACAYPNIPIALCEVVAWYQYQKWPEQVHLTPNPHEARIGAVSVNIRNGRGQI